MIGIFAGIFWSNFSLSMHFLGVNSLCQFFLGTNSDESWNLMQKGILSYLKFTISALPLQPSKSLYKDLIFSDFMFWN